MTSTFSPSETTGEEVHEAQPSSSFDDIKKKLSFSSSIQETSFSANAPQNSHADSSNADGDANATTDADTVPCMDDKALTRTTPEAQESGSNAAKQKKQSANASAPHAEKGPPMKVYLRIRPFSENEIQNGEKQETLRVLNSSTVKTNPPLQSNTFKASKTSNVCGKFRFTHVFQETASQTELFTTTTLPMIKELFQGQHCLMFTTGVTNSGKTHTIQGTPTDPGLLPRALALVFATVQRHMGTTHNIRPKKFNEVKRITAEEVKKEEAIKQSCLASSRTKDESHFGDLPAPVSGPSLSLTGTTSAHALSDTTTAKEHVQGHLNAASATNGDDAGPDGDNHGDDVAASVDMESIATCTPAEGGGQETNYDDDEPHSFKYAVYVTYVEIYKERVYDLLVPPPADPSELRESKRLRTDRNENVYVEGLREIRVDSIGEAMRVLGVGRRNRQIAATTLNINSSRSHCIFTLKILKYPDTDAPTEAQVTHLSLVDLAGSERNNNTNTRGMSLKEAASINKSIMALGQCLDALRFLVPSYTSAALMASST